MNFDLFTDEHQAQPEEYLRAFEGWLVEAGRAGRLQRESSVEVYQHMWSALTAWAVGNRLPINELTAQDLADYLDSRGSSEELSERYAWRLLRLTDRVLLHHASSSEMPPNPAAVELLQQRPDLRYANAANRDPLPDFLVASEAKRLVTYLSAVRPGRSAAGQSWQEVRNRASVALMLGAGLAPGEVRSLKLTHVVTDGGRLRRVPWKLRIGADGNGPAHETPVAQWAGQLLRYWLDVRSQQSIPGMMLLPSTKSTGKPWGKVAHYNASNEVLAAAGLDPGAGGSFRLRHTFALRQLRRGRATGEVAQWLGVSDPAVMARYQRVLMAPVDVA